MYETERMERKRIALAQADKRQRAKMKELTKMFEMYDSYIAEGLTQGSAITRTSAMTGIARTTVAQRVWRKYGKCSMDQ